MNVGNVTDILQLPPRANSDLTFKEVGLQPEFEAYQLAVTFPRVASQCEAVQAGQCLEQGAVQSCQPVVRQPQVAKVPQTVPHGSRETRQAEGREMTRSDDTMSFLVSSLQWDGFYCSTKDK